MIIKLLLLPFIWIPLVAKVGTGNADSFGDVIKCLFSLIIFAVIVALIGGPLGLFD
jgi:hypothetical protein